jgi:hypothetical protein
MSVPTADAFAPVQMTPPLRSPNLRPMQSDYNIAPPPSAERLADGVVQSVNVVLAAAGCVVLGVLAGTRADRLRLAALTVYGAGLLAMVGASALYAWGRGSRRHVLYRHLDHAAIFLMIAGTYTPFTVISFSGVHVARAALSPLDLSTWTHVVACVRAFARREITSGHPRAVCALQRVAGTIQMDADTRRMVLLTAGLPLGLSDAA